MEISKNSKVWIYQSTRPFNADEERIIAGHLQNFVSQWEAHGSKLSAKAEILHNRFIILMVDEGRATASGCSIDKSVNLMKHIEQKFNINLFDRFNIAWRENNEVCSCNREEFETLIREGRITENTIVFNNLVQTVGDLESSWQVPFKNSWHAQVFGDLIHA